MSFLLMIKTDEKGSRVLGVYTSVDKFSWALTKLSNQRDITMKEIPTDQMPIEVGMTLKDLNFNSREDYAIVTETPKSRLN
jgi:hypothetical protein